MKKPTEWEIGAPPTIGIYRVKSDADTKKITYRYWNGEWWGCQCSTREICQKWGRRVVKLKHAILWDMQL